MIKDDFVFGLISSFVPIYLISTKFGSKIEKNGINFSKIVRVTPITFAIINTVAMIILRNLGISNLFLVGAIMSIIWSSLGRFGSQIPQKVFEMKNPNMFHLYALVTWTIFYGIVGQIFYEKSNI